MPHPFTWLSTTSKANSCATLMDALLHAGVHLARWDGRDELGHSAATGPYFARLRIGHGPPHYVKLLFLR